MSILIFTLCLIFYFYSYFYFVFYIIFIFDFYFHVILQNVDFPKKKFELVKNNYALLTLHRPQNVDKKEQLKFILNEIKKISDKFKIKIKLIQFKRKIMIFFVNMYNKKKIL